MFTYGLNQGVKFVAPIFIWVIEGAEARVVVDAGMWPPDWPAAGKHQAVTQTPDQEPATALRAVGCPPEDVDIVLLSHLHADHIHNLELFKRARIYVQARELRYAVAPLSVHTRFQEKHSEGGTPPYIRVFDQLALLDGDQEIVPGITSILLPGHSPGGMGVAVETAEGPYIIAGDLISVYENWEGHSEQGVKHVMPGAHYSLEECQRSYAKLEELERQGYRILPAHDPRVLEHETYP